MVPSVFTRTIPVRSALVARNARSWSALHGDDGTEDLLVDGLVVLADARDDGDFVEVAGQDTRDLR